MQEHPVLNKTHKYYEMTRFEQQEDLWKKAKFLYNLNRKMYFEDAKFGEAPHYKPLPLTVYSGEFPGLGLHQSMFTLGVEGLASEE